MKIHVDKIEGGPPHALKRRDVRLIFETVPRDWTSEIKEVHISNSLEWRSHTFFSHYTGRLTIYSRKRTKERVLASVLSELAAIPLRDRGWRYRSKAVRDDLKNAIEPFFERLLLLIAPTPPADLLKQHVSLEGFQELRFPFVPNDDQK